jgi:hypothetical protein
MAMTPKFYNPTPSKFELKSSNNLFAIFINQFEFDNFFNQIYEKTFQEVFQV